MREFWRAADDLGVFRGGWVYDHLLPIFTDGAGGPVLESWTLLTALGASTTRLRLGVMVSGNVYRNPALLMKMATSIDVISDGRVDLGLGAGWNAEEYQRFGFGDVAAPGLPPVRERMDRLDEACAVVTAMRRSPDGATVQGRYHGVDRAVLDPAPLGPLPLYIGGRGERRTLRTAARFADGWNLPAGDAAVLAHKRGVLERHCADLGRDPAEVEVSAQVVVDAGIDAAVDKAQALRAAGAGHVVFVFDPPLRTVDLQALATRLDEHTA
ncbi:LLM class flavin-dependent oxidoreductase [Egicoccus sp. AB-alg2]|uniref:LLM class flavin-dependent oxidoreductase n=1 Tax=Egicoccus sp. AB-alg2 TaxID=3242693 RepID=UPI00359E420D